MSQGIIILQLGAIMREDGFYVLERIDSFNGHLEIGPMPPAMVDEVIAERRRAWRQDIERLGFEFRASAFSPESLDA